MTFSGKIPLLSSCHNGPFGGRSKLQESSNIAIPRLKISADLEKFPCISSGAIYRESPSVAWCKFSLN